MRRFFLKRLKDVSGSSGVGCVAEGVLFQDGTAVLNWFAGIVDATSTGIFPTGIAGVERIHGHSGNTFVEFIDDKHIEPLGTKGTDTAFAVPPAPISSHHVLPIPA